MPKITIELEMSELHAIRQVSVERMINTAIRCGEILEQIGSTEYDRELGSTSWQDWEDYKVLLTKICNAVSARAFEELNKKE